MNSLLILGAGGHGKVVADAAMATGAWREIAFLDDRVATIGSVLDLMVLGEIDSLSSFTARFSHAVVAVGDARGRLRLIAELARTGYAVAVIVHPRATISPSAKLAAGSVVMAGAVVNPDVMAGSGVIINTGACVDHDCRLGDGVHICPGANLAGNVIVHDLSWIGIGACVKSGLTIGHDVMVGAGATVTEDVGDGLTVVGTPARPMVRAPSDD